MDDLGWRDRSRHTTVSSKTTQKQKGARGWTTNTWEGVGIFHRSLQIRRVPIHSLRVITATLYGMCVTRCAFPTSAANLASNPLRLLSMRGHFVPRVDKSCRQSRLCKSHTANTNSRQCLTLLPSQCVPRWIWLRPPREKRSGV